MTHGVATAHTNSCLLKHPEELFGQRTGNGCDDPCQCRVEAETRFNRDDEKIQQIGKGPKHLMATLIDFALQPCSGPKET